MADPKNILSLLEKARAGSQEALDRLLPLVYDDLREIAHSLLRDQKSADPLQTTALVHEGYLTLRNQRAEWQNDSHLLGVAATAMRRILVNRVQSQRRLKRGDAHRRVELNDTDLAVDTDEELVAVDDAIERLSRADERKARLVELRFFTGLSLAESARVLGVSLNTAKRDWTFAKLWILRDIEEDRG